MGAYRADEGGHSSEEAVLDHGLALLEGEGFSCDERVRGQITTHVNLVKQWQKAVSLVSKGDLGRLASRHVVDSLSLARVLEREWLRGSWVDVGSGAGFPALPLRFLLPRGELVLVERNSRKCGFLRQATAKTGIEARLFHGGIEDLAIAGVGVVTARAVERSEGVTGWLCRAVRGGAVFLAQGEAVLEGLKGEGFHVEQVEDAWSKAGLRRGPLFVVKRGG